MSSEIYELMKRPDEVEVVEKAHRRPRFVEDCVREMVRMAVERVRRARRGRVRARRARRTSRRSTSTTSSPSAHGLLGELLREIETAASTSRVT